MTQDERLVWLIRYLLNENEAYADTALPADREERFRLYRSLVNVRMPKPISNEYLAVEDDFLKEEISLRGVTSLGELCEAEDGIYLWQGDITGLACDAIVNAANSQLLGCFMPCHACIDNCIHTFAGVRLRLKCDELMSLQGHPEKTGQAKLTPAYNLPSRYVLHTVGPIVQGALTVRDKALLSSCYLQCLKLAEESGIKSVAFCCISTGVFGFPQREAAEIAVKTVRQYRAEKGSDIKVIFNVFGDKDREIYENLLG